MQKWKAGLKIGLGMTVLLLTAASYAETTETSASTKVQLVVDKVESATKKVLDAAWFDLSEEEGTQDFSQILDKRQLTKYITAVRRLGKLKENEPRDLVVIRTTSSNASALEKEKVMMDFLEKALYSVKVEVEKSAAQLPIPSEIVESTEGFDQEPEKIQQFARKLNNQFISARRKKNSFSSQDFWPDAYVLYLYGFAPRFLNGGVDVQLAAVYVPLNIKVYALPKNKGDKPELLATIKDSDFKIFAIPLVEVSFVGIQTRKIAPKIGIGFVWDNQDIMSGADDLLGTTVGQVGMKTPFRMIYRSMAKLWRKKPKAGADPKKVLPVDAQGLAQLVNTAAQLKVGVIHPITEASDMIDNLSPNYWTLSILWDKDSFFSLFGREPSKVGLDKKQVKKIARVEFNGVAGLFLSLSSVLKMFTGEMESIWKDLESPKKRYTRRPKMKYPKPPYKNGTSPYGNQRF